MDDEKTKNIETILREIAAVHALRLGYNTHYEAYNYEFDWWEGGNHHRLDFQPIDDSLVVTHLTDHYRFLPRVCYWLYSVIPEIFRFPPSVQFTRLGTIKLTSESEMRNKVEEILKAAYNNAMQRIADKPGSR